MIDANVDYQTTGAHGSIGERDAARGWSRDSDNCSACVADRQYALCPACCSAAYANLKEAWAGFWDATMSPV